MLSKKKARDAVRLLINEYPNAKPQLVFSSEFELLVAVILSAQCTDIRVNQVTKHLFSCHNTPQSMLELDIERLAEMIKPCGLHNAKAKHIIAASRAIVDRFSGQVPNTVKELKTLEGVGQKTANVVYSVAFGGDAIAVDTHVFRLARRIGFSIALSPTGVEKDLCRLIDRNEWSKSHHCLILHGRAVCKAATPKCKECCLEKICEKSGVRSAARD